MLEHLRYALQQVKQIAWKRGYVVERNLDVIDVGTRILSSYGSEGVVVKGGIGCDTYGELIQKVTVSYSKEGTESGVITYVIRHKQVLVSKHGDVAVVIRGRDELHKERQAE